SPKEVAEKVTMGGIEISSVESLDKGIRKVITAEVRSVKPHPNADKLTCCTVFTGQEELSIVCGAKNIKAGDKAPLAIVGAALPGGKEITEAEIRGVKSFGMMCSERELGISEEHGGIMILPPDTVLGQDINTVLDLDDYLLEAEPTPNRGDVLSILGVARELAAVLNLKVKLPLVKLKETADKVENFISVEIKDPELCPRYTARYLHNVAVQASPLWIQNRLRNCGLRLINNIVDITNYVLLELGQPLHAFDAALIGEQKIIVRRAKEREEIVTLDGIRRKLGAKMLVIADARKPVALAGIMGGELSSVKKATTALVLESAYFNPVSIRKTAKAVGLNTDASYRFERGVDVENVALALNRIAQLIQDLAGGQAAKGLIDEYPQKIKPPRITVRQERINKILGLQLSFSHTKKILKSLGFMFTENTGTESLHVVAPTWRNDLTREIDIIEELARINGYEEIPAALPKGQIIKIGSNSEWEYSRKIASYLKYAGFSEAINYSFISEKDYARIGAATTSDQFIRVANPLTEDAAIMRTTLVCGLLNNMVWNINHGNNEVKIFEQGRVFLGKGKNTYANEVNMLGLAISGISNCAAWNQARIPADIFYVKGVLAGLLKSCGLESIEFRTAGDQLYHPALCLEVMVNGEKLGLFGRLSTRVMGKYGLAQEVYLGELNLDKLLALATGKRQYHAIPKLPGIRRDLALLLPQDVSHAAVVKTLRETASPLVKEISLFDVYQGEKVEPGYKSYAYSLLYQAADRTLQDEEVNRLHTDLINLVVPKLNARVR
ncbi:MAG: phenylalanine--tRNA ligase subunit beta, partial [Elusimicrobia bacterium]|nr:phenylalanine--tRNA ligase subunit beta [Elusimicrobiota bacterium]